MARIVLIYPRFEPTFWGSDYAMPIVHYKAVMPPINLALLGALTPDGNSITVIDENVEPIDFDRCAQADIIGVTGMIVQRTRMREILSELKRRGLFTVVGGPCATVDPEGIADVADVIFLGEAELTWPRFLAEWKEGCHQPRYEQTEKTDITTVPPPRLELLKMNKYLFGSLQISRGCPFTCEFCDIIVVFGRRPRLKTAAQVIAELDGLVAAGKELVFIVDDNLIANKKAMKPILREIIAWQKVRGYPLVFTTEASIDLAEDEEMMQLMVEANFEAVFVGIESPNEDALRETKKIQNLADRRGTVLEKVHRIQQVGMEVLCGMIVGFDNDDESVFATQRRFIAESRITLTMVNILTAIPKTPLFTRLMNESRLDNGGDSATFSTLSTNVIPLRMSRQTLCDGYIQLLRDLYAPSAFFARLDALFLDTDRLPHAAQRRYLRDHPWRRLKKTCQYVLETTGMFVEIMRLVPDSGLRREYRRRLWRVIKRRPYLTLLRMYCFKSALHFHYHQLIQRLAAKRQAMGPEIDNIRYAATAEPGPPAMEPATG